MFSRVSLVDVQGLYRQPTESWVTGDQSVYRTIVLLVFYHPEKERRKFFYFDSVFKTVA